ncbi:MAG: histidine kinase dimerization/phospho-acceptor domain-containing protein [Myxococcota bacterium]
MGELAAGIAHEINNPLAIIAEDVGMLKDSVNPELEGELEPGELEERLDEIHDAVFRCRDITRKLLTFVRQTDIKLESLPIEQLLDDVINGMLGKELLLGNVQVERDYGFERRPLITDRNQLVQVFVNLVKNAIDAMLGGHVDGTQAVRCGHAERGRAGYGYRNSVFADRGLDGGQVKSMLKADQPDIEAIILTGHGTLDSVVELSKAGAFTCLPQTLRVRRPHDRVAAGMAYVVRLKNKYARERPGYARPHRRNCVWTRYPGQPGRSANPGGRPGHGRQACVRLLGQPLLVLPEPPPGDLTFAIRLKRE